MRLPMNRFQLRFVCVLAIAFLCVSCASTGKVEFRQGHEAMKNKDWDQAVEFFMDALKREPGNIKYRLALVDAMLTASKMHTEKGIAFAKKKQPKLALREFEKALESNPENNIAQTKKQEILKRFQQAEEKRAKKSRIHKAKARAAKLNKKSRRPALKYKQKEFSLKFRGTDIKQILKVLQKSSGINFLYDPTFRSRKIALELQNVKFLAALRSIMVQSKSFYKILDERTVVIVPDTPTKRREYEELAIRTFFLSNANPDDLRKLLVPLTGIKTMAIDKSLNTLTVKGSLEQVQLVEKLVEIHDKPRGELFVDVEIIEVKRGRAKQYGIELSNYQVTQSYSPVTGDEGDAGNTGSTIRLNMIPHTDASDYLLSLPQVVYKLLRTDTESRIKARPKLRVLDMEEIKIKLGDKVPIPATSFVPYNTGGPAQQPITSYNMEDIGINITLTPRIHHDGLITLKIEFESTFITSPGTAGVPPTIGNRSVKTVIKLRDNETSILAGLLRDTERRTMRGFPLLSSIPILREIFGGNSREVEQTDIIFTLTPRIVRYPQVSEKDLEYIWAGTLRHPGLSPSTPGLSIMDEGAKKGPGTARRPPNRSRPPANRRNTGGMPPPMKKQEKKKK